MATGPVGFDVITYHTRASAAAYTVYGFTIRQCINKRIYTKHLPGSVTAL